MTDNKAKKTSLTGEKIERFFILGVIALVPFSIATGIVIARLLL